MNKRASGAIVSYVYTAVRILVNLIYVPILISGIGRAEYGLYQTVGSVIAYLNLISSTLSAGATRYFCQYHASGDENGKANTLGILQRLYRRAVPFILLATLITIFALRLAYQNSFSDWELTESSILLIVLSLNLIVTMENTLSVAVITAHEEFVFLKGSMTLSFILQPIAVIALIRAWPYALTVCAVQLAVNTGLLVLQHSFATRKLGMDMEERFFDESLQKALLAFSGSIILSNVADQIFWRSSQLILAGFFGTETVAVYGVGIQITLIYMSLGTEIATVFMPEISELWHKERDTAAISELFVRVGRLSFYLLLLVLTGFFIFGPDFIVVWAGDGFEDAYFVALIIMVPFTIDIAQNLGLSILQVMNLFAFRAYVLFGAALASIVATFFVAPRFGNIGAAWVCAIALFIASGLIMNVYYARRAKLDIAGFWKSITRMSVPLLLLCAFVWTLRRTVFAASGLLGFSQLAIFILAYSLLYFVVAWLFSMNDYEHNLVKSLISRFVPKC